MEDELKYSYNVLKFDLAAGMTDVEVPIHAQRIDYVSPTDGPELSIRLQRKSNDQLPLRPNGSIEAPFTRLYISAPAVAKTVFLMVGAPVGVRVTGRDVSISGTIDSLPPIAAAGSRGSLFAGTVSRLGVAATFSHVCLYNPANSGKTVTLLAMRYHNHSATVATFFESGRVTTPLAVLEGAAFNVGNTGGQSTAELRKETNAALLTLDAVAGVYRRREYLPVSTSGKWFECYDNIPQGVGVSVHAGIQNHPVIVDFLFTEG